MTLLLDLAFISKVHKPVTDQEPEETQTKCSQQKTTPFISETIGSNINVISTDIQPSFISELKDQLKSSADDKNESSLHPSSTLFYNYKLLYIKLMLFSVSVIYRAYDKDMILSDCIEAIYTCGSC